MSRGFQAVGPLRFSDQPLLKALLERIARVAGDYLEIQVKAGADAVQIFDTWGSILSQEEWGRLSASYIAPLIERARALGVPSILYVNGCAPYLEQMAALRPDAISIDWRTSLAAARRVVGPGIALQGNLDPLALLAGPEAARREVARLFEGFPAAPGHVFNLGHGILPTTPVEAARAALQAVRDHGAY